MTSAVSKLAGAERPPQFQNFAEVEIRQNRKLDHASRADRTLDLSKQTPTWSLRGWHPDQVEADDFTNYNLDIIISLTLEGRRITLVSLFISFQVVVTYCRSDGETAQTMASFP